MPQPRIPFEPELMYHVWTHANGSENLFRTEENYLYFLGKYAHHIQPVAETFAYCLMPNHLHLMIRVREEIDVLKYLRLRKNNPTLQGFETLGGFSNAISLQFSHLFNGYTQSYNNIFDRKGSLFIPNFKRKRIDSEAYFVRLIAYIHNNPVHHGFAQLPEDWPYSSWQTYLAKSDTKICRDEALEWFGGREAFVGVHRSLVQDLMVPLFEE